MSSQDRYNLTFDEMTRARYFFHKHADEYITQEFQMRTILGEMGQYPPSTEIVFCIDQFERKMNFNNFCNYCCYLKKKYSKPEPKDVDTLRAFVALGGIGDRTGDISTDKLRAECGRFHLTIDLDAMLREVDEDGSGTIDYGEFAAMWLLGGIDDPIPDDGSEDGVSPSFPGSKSLSSRSMREEVSLDDDDNLNVVRGFLFPLQRQQTAQIMMEKSARRKQGQSTRKSFVSLPPLERGKSIMNRSMVRDREKEADGGDRVVEDEEMAPVPPPQAHTARKPPPGFVPPSPIIMGAGRSSGKKKESSISPRKTPRKPHSARGQAKRSRLY